MSQTSQRPKKVWDLVSDKIDLMEFGLYALFFLYVCTVLFPCRWQASVTYTENWPPWHGHIATVLLIYNARWVCLPVCLSVPVCLLSRNGPTILPQSGEQSRTAVHHYCMLRSLLARQAASAQLAQAPAVCPANPPCSANRLPSHRVLRWSPTDWDTKLRVYGHTDLASLPPRECGCCSTFPGVCLYCSSFWKPWPKRSFFRG